MLEIKKVELHSKNNKFLIWLGLAIVILFIGLLIETNAADANGLQESPKELETDLYADELDPNWQIILWGEGGYDLSAVSPFYSGARSFELWLQDPILSALLIESTTLLDPNGYERVRFYIYGTATGQTVSFELWDRSYIEVSRMEIELEQNSWKLVEMSLTDLEALRELQRFVFKDASSAEKFYVDDLILVAKPPVGTHVIYLPTIIKD